MLDEEMDHMIRDAAEKHHPAYNDKAWEKMEKMLDKHLPQNKDRRRYPFFLLLFLLLGGAAFFGITYFNAGKKQAAVNIAENKSPGQIQPVNNKEQAADNSRLSSNSDPVGNSSANTVDKNAGPVTRGNNRVDAEKSTVPGTNITSSANDNAAKLVKNKPGKYKAGNRMPLADDNKPGSNSENAIANAATNKRRGVKKGRSNISITAPDAGEETVKAESPDTKNKTKLQGKASDRSNITVTPAEPESGDNKNINVAAIPADSKKENAVQAEQKKEGVKAEEKKKGKEIAKTDNKTQPSPGKKKQKNNIPGNFAITVSAGPDLSFVSLNKLGKATLAYGAGLSYTFRNRLTLSSGFYYARKIYTATPDQYKMPGGTSYPYLDAVDANCKVYEIPVNLSYSFAQRKNHAWFGNVGLSTLLMKNEYYNYEYKIPGGTVYNYPYEVSNQNKHYFSVLTLSGGYQYRLSKQVSLQAEPYVKLPLSGIGQGKIKLSSAGVLFTVAIRPFARKK